MSPALFTLAVYSRSLGMHQNNFFFTILSQKIDKNPISQSVIREGNNKTKHR